MTAPQYNTEIGSRIYSGPNFLRPISVFLFSQILFVIYPIFAVYMDDKGNEIYSKSLFIASLSLVIVYGSYILFRKILLRKTIFSNFIIQTNTTLIYKIFYLYFLIAPILLFAHVAAAGVVPLFESIGGANHLELAYAREAYDKDLNPLLQIFVNLGERIIPMFLLVILLAHHYIEKDKKSKRYALVTLIYFIFVSSLALAKTQPVVALLLYLIVSMLGKKRSAAYYSTTLILMLFGIGIMGVIAGGSDASIRDIPVIIQDLVFRRVFTLTAEVFSAYISIFPAFESHLYGKGIRLISMLQGDFHFQLSNLVYSYMFPDGIDSGWANTAYQGELWADFGYLGIVIGSVFLGGILAKTTSICCDMKKNYRAYSIVVHAFSFLLIIFLSVSSMFSSIILLMIAVVMIMRFVFFRRIIISSQV